MKKVVFTFGRMNPPTIGHAKLVKKVQDVAKQNRADAEVYLSHTQNNKKDPLTYDQKIRFAQKAFGRMVVQSKSKTVFDILKEFDKRGYSDVVMVVGSDRVQEFDKLLNKYNGKDYKFDSITVVSAGERDPDATGVEGMSASKLRAVAKEGDFKTFKTGLPKGLNDKDAKEIFDTINTVIKESLEEAPLSLSQRLARGRQMKRLAPKLARMRRLRAKRMADPEALKKRAAKAARNVIRKKVAGDRGASYAKLSASEKITIDKLVAKKSAVIQKLAKKLLPKVRKAEQERLKSARSTKNEEFDINELFEQKVAQDPDVKDMPGTQPKKYYKGLSDKDKEARAKQFAKGADKPDGSDSSYKPAPGDAEAETKPSKHTLKYKKMFGEKSEVEKAREKIKAEKEADKSKHDAMLDRARTQDTQSKNAKTEEFELSEDSKAALQKKAEKSGISYSILKKVYDRGMAAWKTGHRPGATQQQWGYARVNSFITGGKTRTTADADLWKQHKGTKSESVNEAVSPAQQAAIAISKKKKLNAMLGVPDARPKADDLEEMPRWLMEPISKVTRKKGYEAAKKILKDVLTRKKKEGKLKHDVYYYASQIAKQFKGVDARVLGDMISESVDLSENVDQSVVYADNEVKMKGLFEFDKSLEEEGGAGEWGTDKLVKKYKKDTPISEAIEYHRENDLSIKENIFRPHSENYYAFFRECRSKWLLGEMDVTDPFDKMLMESDAGMLDIYEGEQVPLDIPLVEEDNKELNKPKRGGSKKFYVFVKDPSTGNVKKVSFGDTSGLKAKIDDPEARKSFAARHKCSQQKDKTTAAYWSCRLPYYAKELGLEGGGSFFW
jgi:hypothetical protein